MSGANRGAGSEGRLTQQDQPQGEASAESETVAGESDGAAEAAVRSDAEPVQPIETADANAQTEIAEQLKNADLIAQQDMAFWAMLMFWATLATVVISSVALLLLKLTLDATARAAEHAQTMADEARKTTQLANASAAASAEATMAVKEANEIAQQGTERQLRAYVTMKKEWDFEAPSVGSPLRASPEIKNFGQSPAYIDSFRANCQVTEDRDFLFDFDKGEFPDGASRSVLGSGESEALLLQAQSALTQDLWQAIHDRTKYLIVSGRVLYRDVFGNQHTTTFRAEYDPTSDGFKHTFVGNEAT